MAALIFGLKHFKQINNNLLDTKTLIRTDYAAFTYIRRTP